MKTKHSALASVFIFSLFFLAACNDRLFDNPYDPAAEARAYEILATLQVSGIVPVDITFSGEASGGTADYTFEWTSDYDGYLGSGASILSSLTTASKEGQLSKHIVTLQVTDANGMQGTATIEVYINAVTLLPLVVK